MIHDSQKIVAIVPCHDEEDAIGFTLDALLAQHEGDYDLMIVVAANGCTDNTAAIARRYESENLHVLELPMLKHRKAEALNIAWNKYGREADIIVCLDADTVLPPDVLNIWCNEFLAVPHGKGIRSHGKGVRSLPLGGTAAKFTMRGGSFLTRMQRAEFAKWIDTALLRGWSSIVGGAASALSGKVVREIAAMPGRPGPWTYDSQVEDFELTYQMRQLGYRCQVSPGARAYTDSMRTLKALWSQRMKWQTGTIEDLLSFGFTRLTLLDWFQQTVGLLMGFTRLLWLAVIAAQVTFDLFEFSWWWCLLPPFAFAAIEVYFASRIPDRDRLDLVLSALVIPNEIFAWLRSAWFMWAWLEILSGKLTGKRKDRWSLQYSAEGIGNPTR